MDKNFNPSQRFCCSLCGWYYTSEAGHDYIDCAGRIKQGQIDLAGTMRDLEQKYQEANRRAQLQKEEEEQDDYDTVQTNPGT